MQIAVIFDMDGVIVDNGDFHYRAWKKFCENNNIAFSQEKFRKVFFGRTNEQVLPVLFGRDLSHEEIQKLGDEKEEIYREIYRPHLTAVPGLVPFLAELKNNKIATAVATSASPENVEFVLNGLGIKHLFDVIIDDSMVSKGKPDPEVYLKSAAKLNMNPQHCVVFEDSLSGTKAAFDAGAKVVALTTSIDASEHKYAQQIITDFSEISVNFILQKLFS